MPPSKASAADTLPALPSGLDAAPFDAKKGERLVIAERAEYSYYAYHLTPGQRIVIDHLSCAAVFLPVLHNELTEITVNGTIVPAGSSALAELTALEVIATKGSGYALIAGATMPTPGAMQQLTVHTADEHYIVHKPWGHELWINGEHPVFSFKEVFIKEGCQTSLQYHHYKKEAALLYHGVCDIVYKANNAVGNDEVRPEDLAVEQLAAPGRICVDPGTLHRMRAATDMVHYEVSTPHLDDVVRVQDDHKRGHGRILEEHEPHAH